jgi:hypothetical protein
VATAGLLAFAGPAAATNTFSTCTAGQVTGRATISPPISHTNSNTTPSTTISTSIATGCSGKITGGTTTSTVTSLDPTTGKRGPVNCNDLITPPPAGTKVEEGTFTATWSNDKTSKGTVKIESTGGLGTEKLIETVKSGFGFSAGHVTQISGTISFTPTTGDCFTTDLSAASFVNTTNVTFVKL